MCCLILSSMCCQLHVLSAPCVVWFSECSKLWKDWLVFGKQPFSSSACEKFNCSIPKRTSVNCCKFWDGERISSLLLGAKAGTSVLLQVIRVWYHISCTFYLLCIKFQFSDVSYSILMVAYRHKLPQKLLYDVCTYVHMKKCVVFIVTGNSCQLLPCTPVDFVSHWILVLKTNAFLKPSKIRTCVLQKDIWFVECMMRKIE